jgi:hypothetical protein
LRRLTVFIGHRDRFELIKHYDPAGSFVIVPNSEIDTVAWVLRDRMIKTIGEDLWSLDPTLLRTLLGLQVNRILLLVGERDNLYAGRSFTRVGTIGSWRAFQRNWPGSVPSNYLDLKKEGRFLRQTKPEFCVAELELEATQPEPSSRLATLWKDVVKVPTIPYDRAKRREVCQDAFRTLEPRVRAWENAGALFQ